MKASLILLLSFAAYLVESKTTTVAVLNFGKDAVRRTTSNAPTTTVSGVASFWKALHSYQRQTPNMSVIPDMFYKAPSSVVVGIKGDMETPFVTSLLEETHPNVVGTMIVKGARCETLMSYVPDFEQVQNLDSVMSHVAKPGLTGVQWTVDATNNNNRQQQQQQLDQQLLELMQALDGHDVVLHVIVEGNDRRRRLEDEQQQEEEGQEEEGQDAENNQDDKENNGFYGYGYFNEFGEYVTPYKTMFQIQYFNVVLWTAIGLAIGLFYSIGLMVGMPLEADTLLFGESAKFVGDE